MKKVTKKDLETGRCAGRCKLKMFFQLKCVFISTQAFIFILRKKFELIVKDGTGSEARSTLSFRLIRVQVGYKSLFQRSQMRTDTILHQFKAQQLGVD